MNPIQEMLMRLKEKQEIQAVMNDLLEENKRVLETLRRLEGEADEKQEEIDKALQKIASYRCLECDAIWWELDGERYLAEDFAEMGFETGYFYCNPSFVAICEYCPSRIRKLLKKQESPEGT